MILSNPTLATVALNPEATFWMPPQGSTIAPSIDWMFMAITYLSYFFFVLVVALMVIFVVRYRQRGREIHPGGPTHHTPLEVMWTVIPLLLCVGIFYMGFKGYLKMATPPQNAYQIDVIAYQWGWNFRYPTGAQSDQLYIPANQPVKLLMRSEDVLHSLYIPDFRVKKDVVPGRYTVMWFEAPNATGDAEGAGHWLFCTEYCGTDHSNMNRKVYVLGREDFDIWLEKQGRWLDDIPAEELYYKGGSILFKRCVSCHSIDGKPGTGPTWGPYGGMPAIWERTRDGIQKVNGGIALSTLIGPGKVYETPEDYLRVSILNPGKHIVDGYGNAMPTFQGQLNDKAIDALINMMKRLDEFNPDGSWKGPSGTTAAATP